VLGHKVRFDAFRLLIRKGPAGLPFSEAAAGPSVPPTAVSFHLATSDRAGLLRSRREDRNIPCAVDLDRIRDLVVLR
jgi:ArsR family transcriptional regulator, arsenate/arsenite/antimonite-responsive transcriptional repressor